MFSAKTLSLALFLASTCNALNFDQTVRRFLQEAVGANPAAPFDLSVGLVGAGGEVGVEDEKDSSGGGGAIVAIVVVIVLLLLCCACSCCIGGVIYFHKKKNANEKEETAQHKAVGVPYGGERPRGGPQRQYSDRPSHASTASHASFD